MPSTGSKESSYWPISKIRLVDPETDTPSDDNEVDVDTIEIAHEGLTIKDAL